MTDTELDCEWQESSANVHAEGTKHWCSQLSQQQFADNSQLLHACHSCWQCVQPIKALLECTLSCLWSLESELGIQRIPGHLCPAQ
jgi:hypothetical protein